MLLRECSGHELHGILQLFRLRTVALAHHAGHLCQDFHSGSEAAAPDQARKCNGQRREPAKPAPSWAPAARNPCRQVPVHYRRPLRPLLAACARPQLPHPLHRSDKARLRHVHFHYTLTCQLSCQPHYLCLPHPGVQKHLPENFGTPCSLPSRRHVPELQWKQEEKRTDHHDHRSFVIGQWDTENAILT